MNDKKTEPDKMTLAALCEHLGIELWQGMEIVRFANTNLREDLIHWLNHPEEWLSNK